MIFSAWAPIHCIHLVLLSPSVHVARWAHMGRFLSVHLSLDNIPDGTEECVGCTPFGKPGKI